MSDVTVCQANKAQTNRAAALHKRCTGGGGRASPNSMLMVRAGELVLWVDTSLDGRQLVARGWLWRGRTQRPQRDGFAAPVTWHKRIAGLKRESKESLSRSLLFNGGAITLMGRSAPQIYRTQFVLRVAAPACTSVLLSRRENKKQETHTTIYVSHTIIFWSPFLPDEKWCWQQIHRYYFLISVGDSDGGVIHLKYIYNNVTTNIIHIII